MTSAEIAAGMDSEMFGWWVPMDRDADGRAHAFPVFGPGFGRSTCSLARWNTVSRKATEADAACLACEQQRRQRIAERLA